MRFEEPFHAARTLLVLELETVVIQVAGTR